MPAQRSVVTSAKLIALCTLLSRITGLARDILLARAFGLAWVQDAWIYAFQFPNLFRRLFGEGAMAAAFVPTFTRTLEAEGRPAAWQLLARTLALMTVVLTIVILLIAAIIALIWFWSTGPGEVLAARRLLLSLTALMLPFMLTICILALLSSILNCVGSFVPAALAPVVLNLCMIAGIAWLAPALHPEDDQRQVRVIALTVVGAGILQLLLILPILRAHGVQLGWRLEFRDPGVQRMLRLLVPVLLGQGVLVFGVFLDAQVCVLLTHKAGTPDTAHVLGLAFAYPLEEGALSAVTYAQRLYQFPLGVLVISLSTAALPTFTRLATREDWPTWSRHVQQSLRLAVFEGALAGAMMIVMPDAIVRLLFERGDFTAADTERTARVLVLYGFGLWAFCAQHLVVRAFYSRHDVRTPLLISVVLLPLNVLLNLTLVWFDGLREAAFALSSGITATLAVVSSALILHRRVTARVIDGVLLLGIAKTLAAAVLAGGAVVLLRDPWQRVVDQVPPGLLANSVETLGLLALGTVTFLVAAALLRLPEVRLILAHRATDPGAPPAAS